MVVCKNISVGWDVERFVQKLVGKTSKTRPDRHAHFFAAAQRACEVAKGLDCHGRCPAQAIVGPALSCHAETRRARLPHLPHAAPAARLWEQSLRIGPLSRLFRDGGTRRGPALRPRPLRGMLRAHPGRRPARRWTKCRRCSSPCGRREGLGGAGPRREAAAAGRSGARPRGRGGAARGRRAVAAGGGRGARAPARGGGSKG